MTTVAEAFGHRTPRLSADHPKIAFNANVGIELEIEGVTHLEVPYWNCTEDGSLRDGCELVCAEPYSGETLYAAIDALSEAVTNSRAQGTWRCSTHVHLDVRDCDETVVQKIILAWAFYEKMMFKCSGFHRYRSNFCPAFAVVQAQLVNASAAFNRQGQRFFDYIVGNWDKYTSLNLLPLSQFGSVEFRVSEPKWKRTNLINLVNRYLVLKKLAVENAQMTNEDFVNMLRVSAFQPMVDYLPLDYMIDPDDLEDGYVLAKDIIHVRRSGVNVVPRVRLHGTPEQLEDTEVSIRDVLLEFNHYASHCLAKDSAYVVAFSNIFDTNHRSEVRNCTIRQIRRLINDWTVIAEANSNRDSEILRTVLSGWNRSFDSYLEQM